VYPAALVQAWTKQEERGSDALKHERLILICGWAVFSILLAVTALR
jgi:hypothetical protein